MIHYKIKTLIKLFIIATPLRFLAVSSQFTRTKLNHQLPTIKSTIELDGVLSEVAWGNALKIELNSETSPGENIPPSIRNTAYLFESGKPYL